MGRALSARRTQFCQGRELRSRPRRRCSASLSESIRSPNLRRRDEWQVAIPSSPRNTACHGRRAAFRPRSSGNGSDVTKAKASGVAKTGLPGRTRRTRVTSEQTRMIETLRRARQPFRKIARAAGLSLGPVARIAKANGLRRLSALDQTIKIIGDEKKPPGAMIPIDIKKRGRSQGVGHRTTGNRKGQSVPRRRKEAGNGFGISGRRRSLRAGRYIAQIVMGRKARSTNSSILSTMPSIS
jgi:hypothetical protein